MSIRFGRYDQWKLASPHNGDDTEPEVRCEVCDEMFTPDEEHQVVHHECWCDYCGTPKADCPGYCEIHGTHLTDAGSRTHESFICEACTAEAEAPARMREQVEGLRGLL